VASSNTYQNPSPAGLDPGNGTFPVSPSYSTIWARDGHVWDLDWEGLSFRLTADAGEFPKCVQPGTYQFTWLVEMDTGGFSPPTSGLSVYWGVYRPSLTDWVDGNIIEGIYNDYLLDVDVTLEAGDELYYGRGVRVFESNGAPLTLDVATLGPEFLDPDPFPAAWSSPAIGMMRPPGAGDAVGIIGTYNGTNIAGAWSGETSSYYLPDDDVLLTLGWTRTGGSGGGSIYLSPRSGGDTVHGPISGGVFRMNGQAAVVDGSLLYRLRVLADTADPADSGTRLIIRATYESGTSVSYALTLSL
jgi:hypothetical protein